MSRCDEKRSCWMRYWHRFLAYLSLLLTSGLDTLHSQVLTIVICSNWLFLSLFEASKAPFCADSWSCDSGKHEAQRNKLAQPVLFSPGASPIKSPKRIAARAASVQGAISHVPIAYTRIISLETCVCQGFECLALILENSSMDEIWNQKSYNKSYNKEEKNPTWSIDSDVTETYRHRLRPKCHRSIPVHGTHV